MNSFMQSINEAIHKRFMASEFRIRTQDGREIVTAGQKDKLPISRTLRGHNPKFVRKTAAERARKQAKQQQNRIIRGDLYREMALKGKLPEWHTTLDALSKGVHG